MREGPILEGRGAPPKSPAEWVKHKLAVRYTEAGRIGDEVDKIEKVMGPLTPKQRTEAAERLHLEGKIKNKVVVTVVKDAVIGTAVVAGTGFLIARPDVRAGISSSLRAVTSTTGEAISYQLDKAATRLKPADGQKQTFFKRLLLGIVNAARITTDKGSVKISHMWDKAAQASLESMQGRVVNADVDVKMLKEKMAGGAGQKAESALKKATGKLYKLEHRQAAAQAVDFGTNVINYDNLSEIARGAREILQNTQSGLVEANKAERVDQVAEKLAKRMSKAKKVVPTKA